MIKYLSFTSILLLLISCSAQDNSIALDCSNLEYLVYDTLSSDSTDSLISEFNRWHVLSSSRGITFQSNKTKYLTGEIVVLTVENNTENITEYYFPNEDESIKQRTLYESVKNTDSLKLKLSRNMVSKSPSIRGQLSQLSEDFHTIILDATDRYTCEIIGCDSFIPPLEPGEKIEYKVTLPNKPGYYVFMLIRHKKDGNTNGYYGFNKFEYSNVFEVK